MLGGTDLVHVSVQQSVVLKSGSVKQKVLDSVVNGNAVLSVGKPHEVV